MKRVIHINSHNIKRNIHKDPDKLDPVFAVKLNHKGERHNLYSHTMRIEGGCDLIYKQLSPLSCGARVWIELDEDAVLLMDGEDVFARLDELP